MASRSPERSAWSLLGRLDARSHRRIVTAAALSALAVLAESLALLFIASAALAARDGTGSPPFGLLSGLTDLGGGARVAATAGAVTLLLALHLATSRVSSTLAGGLLRESRHRVVDSYLRAPWAVQQLEGESRLQDSVASLTVQSSIAAGSLTTEITGLLGLAALSTASLLVNARAAIAVLVLGGIVFILLRPVSARTQTNATVFVSQNSAFNENVSRIAGMARELRAFGVAERAGTLLERDNDAVAGRLSAMRFTTRVGTDLYRDLALLILGGSVAVTAAIDDALVAALATVLILSVRSLSYATSLQTSRQALREQLPNLVELDARIRNLGRPTRDGSNRVESFSRIELNGLGYTYPDGRRALEGVNWSIRSGDLARVTGRSGAGKSTLLDLLIGLRTPTDGQILVDGTSLTELDARCWATLIGLVPQEPTLLPGTIRENITFFRDGFSEDDIEVAVESAFLTDELLRMPQGLSTELGPRGVGISGGQKQRVAIARALLARPQLLVLDEPSSALDPQAAAVVTETIHRLRGSVTIVLVSHHTDAPGGYDSVLELRPE